MSEEVKMKIAVPVTNDNQIDEHFGHCEFYSIFNITGQNEISKIEIIPSLHGCGCKSNIANTLAQNNVRVMLAGGIGAGAISVLNNAGIQVVRGCSGDASLAVKNYLAGNINDTGVNCHQHEAHHNSGNKHNCDHRNN